MPRAAYDTTIDVWTNDGSDGPGVFRFSVPARIVQELRKTFAPAPYSEIDYHINWTGLSISAGTVDIEPPVWTQDWSTADLIIDETTGTVFKAVFTSVVSPRFGGSPYRSAFCVAIA